jgi:hypothetical protein
MTYNVKIDKISTQYVTRERDPNERWDADDLAWDHNIQGFSVVGEKKYWDFVMTKNPKGKTLYLVYALYNTGDSFYCEENVICLVGLYEDKEDAVAVMDALELDNKKNSGRFNPINVKLPKKGVEETIATSTWKGHFERLDTINVEMITESSNRKSVVKRRFQSVYV